MANFLLGLAKGFSDAGRESIKEANKFNQDLEKAARIQSMEAFAEKKKIYDKVNSLPGGTPLAMYLIDYAGGKWDDMDAEQQKKAVDYATENREALLKNFEPGDGPTYDNYRGELKRPKVIDWMKNEIGITPRYAYARQKDDNRIKKIESDLPPLDASPSERVNTNLVGEVDTLEAAINYYSMNGLKVPEAIDNAYKLKYKDKTKVSYVNLTHPGTGDTITVREGSKLMEDSLRNGYALAGKFDLNTEVDYNNLIAPARAKVDEFTLSMREADIPSVMNKMGIPATERNQKAMEHLQSVAETLFDWKNADEEDQGMYDSFVVDVVHRYYGLGEVKDVNARWQKALTESLNNIQPGTKEKVMGITIPFTESPGGIFPINRGKQPNNITREMYEKQRILNSIPEELHPYILSRKYIVRNDGTTWIVINDKGEVAQTGRIK